MNGISNILEKLFCNNSALESELIIANQEIQRRKDTENELRQKVRDYKITALILMALAFIVSWIVVEMVIHGS